MLRAAIASGSELGRRVESVLARGDLVSDDIVIAIITERLRKADCARGAVFDGFPRTIAQAEALDELLEGFSRRIRLVIELKVDDKILIDRVHQRITEGHSRPDDNPETLRNRLAVYYKNTAPLIDYYSRQGKVVTIDGMAPVEAVTRAIAEAIDAKVTA
jgi:adenylate kinase